MLTTACGSVSGKGSTAIFDLVDHVIGLYPVRGPKNDQEIDEDVEENSERTFYFGTKDKTRFDHFKHFLRPAPLLRSLHMIELDV